jgi:Flp pilus assembly protein TadG
MSRATSLCGRLTTSTRGAAAIEFAGIIPILFLLFLATFDAGRALAIYTKVRSATYTLDAIANQYSTIHDSDMQQILGATAVVLSPYPSSPVVVVISQLSVGAGGNATVAWSDTLNGVARSVGSSVTVPAAIATAGTTLIFGEVSYKFTPLFGYFAKGGITFSDNLYVTPRRTASIGRTSP